MPRLLPCPCAHTASGPAAAAPPSPPTPYLYCCTACADHHSTDHKAAAPARLPTSLPCRPRRMPWSACAACCPSQSMSTCLCGQQPWPRRSRSCSCTPAPAAKRCQWATAASRWEQRGCQAAAAPRRSMPGCRGPPLQAAAAGAGAGAPSAPRQAQPARLPRRRRASATAQPLVPRQQRPRRGQRGQQRRAGERGRGRQRPHRVRQQGRPTWIRLWAGWSCATGRATAGGERSCCRRCASGHMFPPPLPLPPAVPCPQPAHLLKCAFPCLSPHVLMLGHSTLTHALLAASLAVGGKHRARWPNANPLAPLPPQV